jgi:outer membrane protein TolC
VVEIALLNNPGLQARIAELGIAEADLVQAGTLRNPVFAYTNKRNAEVVQIERSVLVNIAAILTMPLALEIEQRRFAHAKLAAASEVVATAAAAREAFYRAVSAQEMVAYYNQVKVAAEAGRDLARRMAEVGNFTKLAQMREELFYADATAQLARAQNAAVSERERLTRLLGFAEPPPGLTLPARLPDLPAAPMSLPAAEQSAMDARLDVRTASLETEAIARTLGLTKTTRFINVLDAGYVNESETGNARKNGYEIALELPLFDWGTARVARAEAQYRQAMARAAEVAVVARSEVRAGYASYRTAYELAKHYRDEVVPLRKRIADETALRYNAMLIGVFELLADAREQVASVNTAIEATRDFWLADTALQLALTGRAGDGASSVSVRQPSTAAATASRGH